MDPASLLLGILVGVIGSDLYRRSTRNTRRR